MQLADLYQRYLDHPDIVIDSRKVSQGAFFVSLKGEHLDGNDYARTALENGAAFALVDKEGLGKDERFIRVDDCLHTLQELASFHRRQLDIPVIAITGSNGKTTTKELAAALLSGRYLVHATRGNLNNHIGVPLTLLEMKETAELAIIEMGANHRGEIERLCEIALPDYGLITNVGMAHLEGFGSLEGVRLGKKELYDYLELSGGIVFYNGSDDILRDMMNTFHSGKLVYAQDDAGLCSGSIVETDPGLTVQINIPDEDAFKVETALVGSYNLNNILAATALAVHFRIPTASIRGSLAAYQPRNMRSQRIETDRNVIILDAYNANPTSMRLAIDDFMAMDHEHKIIILGDMLELGHASLEAHQEIVDILSQGELEKVYLIGPDFSACRLPGQFIAFSSVRDAEEWILKTPPSDKLILLKGSRGIGVEALQQVL